MHYFRQAEIPAFYISQSAEQEMGMVRHDNDSVQVELGAIFLKAAFEDNISGIGRKDPAMICGEVMKIGRFSF
jgi:hypothetical protein